MNGDYKDRPLDQWVDEECPELKKDLEIHAEYASKDMLPRLFMGSLRNWWWLIMERTVSNILRHNRELEKRIENLQKQVNLLQGQNRNLRKRMKK